MHFKTLFLNNNRFSIISSGLFGVIAMITLITYASLQLWRENGCLFPIYSMIHQRYSRHSGIEQIGKRSQIFLF